MDALDAAALRRRRWTPALAGIFILLSGLMLSQLGAGREEARRFRTTVDAAIAEMYALDVGKPVEEVVGTTTSRSLGAIAITLHPASVDPASFNSGTFALTWSTGQRLVLGGETYTVEFTAGPNHFVSGRLPITIYLAVFSPLLSAALWAIYRTNNHRVAEANRNVLLADELVKSKDRFIASVSHELRTPLTAISGFASELVTAPEIYTEKERSDMIRIIADQGAEMAHLIEDLLTAARAGAGSLTVRTESFDLRSQVTIVVKELGQESLIPHMPSPIYVSGDRLRTRQVIRNLLTNAVRYGGETIRLNVAGDGESAWVTVADDGKGIEDDRVPEIFNPYVGSVDEGTMPASVGLGLSVAKDLAHLMGGDVEYLREGGWTKFQLTLPAAEPPIPMLGVVPDPDEMSA